MKDYNIIVEQEPSTVMAHYEYGMRAPCRAREETYHFLGKSKEQYP